MAREGVSLGERLHDGEKQCNGIVLSFGLAAMKFGDTVT